MKKLLLILSLVLAFFTSCFEDEGNYNYKKVGDITIEGIDKSYLKYSYVGDLLEIAPNIESNYTNLDYAWYIWDEASASIGKKKKKEMILISSEKNLSYEVDLLPKVYSLMLKVTDRTTGYSSSYVANLEVSTKFQRGFYILKENTEGNSDVDLLFSDEEPLIADVLKTMGQEPVLGSPLALNIVYKNGYIIPGTNNTGECNSLCISTKSKRIAFYNTNDFTKVHDNSDVVYRGLGENEEPYTAFTCWLSNFFISNRGATISYTAEMMPSSGIFGTNSGNGGSPHVAMVKYDAMGGGTWMAMFWNQQKQLIDYADPMWMAHSVGDYDNGEYPTEGMECVMCGASLSNHPYLCYFLLKDTQGRKYLYEANAITMSTNERVELDASSKVANATCYATNVFTANYLYYIYDNQLYAYNLADKVDADQPMTLSGIPAGEQITHLSYQWLQCAADEEEGYNFVNLVVATQTGDTYKVYMYDIVGGEPRNLVRTIEGKGKFCAMRYVTPRFYTQDWSTPDHCSIY